MKIITKRLLLIGSFIITIVIVGFIIFPQTREFHILRYGINEVQLDVKGARQTFLTGLFTGQACQNATRRPLAVMLAGDSEGRPLSGISMADLVIEMPVSPDGITRSMAFFQCHEPSDIGSVRSMRGSFFGLAKGYEAILGHWGGERDALKELKTGIVDNIDAIPNPFSAFYRKKGIPMPHDGFTSYETLWSAAEKLKYPLEITGKEFFIFKALPNDSKNLSGARSSIAIPYGGTFEVTYTYDPLTDSYARSRGGTAEIDVLTKEQIHVKNIVIVSAKISPTYSQYVDVALDGRRGKAQLFRNGVLINGFWEKDAFEKPLRFYDSQGSPLTFEPGAIWIEVVQEGEDKSLSSP